MNSPRRADPNMKVAGELPLCVAALDGNLGFMEILLSANAQIDKKNNKGATPLTIAINCRCAETVEFLVVHNCTVPQAYYKLQRQRFTED